MTSNVTLVRASPVRGVEAGRVVELVAALGAPVPHLYFAGRFIEEFNRVGDSLGFSLGYLALVDKRASRVRRVRACRCEKENREHRQFQVQHSDSELFVGIEKILSAAHHRL